MLHSCFRGWAGNTPLSGVKLRVLYALLGSRRRKVNLRSPRGQPGSNFHIWLQNPMGVLPTKFHPDHINTSQVTPFLKAIISFSGKRLLTPEGVTGFHSLGCFFQGSYLVSIAAKNSLCHRSLFCVNCLFPV